MGIFTMYQDTCPKCGKQATFDGPYAVDHSCTISLSQAASEPSDNINNLISLVQSWSLEHRIPQESDPLSQGFKTLEEVQELLVGLHQNDPIEILDGIGDVLVTLIIQAQMQDLSIEGCLKYAYSQIKNRTGSVQSGQFKKDKEPPFFPDLI